MRIYLSMFCFDLSMFIFFNLSMLSRDGVEMAKNDFVFEFASIELDSISDAQATGFKRGCYVYKPANGSLTDFEIQCDGFACDGCIEYETLGRGSDNKRDNVLVEYNILMNDVLISPSKWAEAGDVNQSIIGTSSLNPDSLIAIARVKTTFDTFYTKCFKNDGNNIFFNFTDDWSSHEADYSAVIDMLGSNDIEDVVAAYDILTTQLENEEWNIPEGEDPKEEVTKALINIIETTDTKNTSIAEIEADISLINLLTSNPDLVDEQVALNITGELIPDLLNKTVELLEEQEETDSTQAGELADRIQTIGSIANS